MCTVVVKVIILQNTHYYYFYYYNPYPALHNPNPYPKVCPSKSLGRATTFADDGLVFIIGWRVLCQGKLHWVKFVSPKIVILN